MALPYFHIDTTPGGNDELVLNEETSSHIVQVLRMKAPEHIKLTDGKGNTYVAEIVRADKKCAFVKITEAEYLPPPAANTCIGISLLKNASRFEWFLEKATEIGVTRIIPLICHRTEKEHFRPDRMKNILVSAMLQSQQSWLPLMDKPVKFMEVIDEPFAPGKYIAHCGEDESKRSLAFILKQQQHTEQGMFTARTILIGPEGDFTKEEIEKAIAHKYIPVSLGETRLRTETAGIASAVLLRFV